MKNWLIICIVLLMISARVSADVEIVGTVTYPYGRPAVGAKVDICFPNTCSSKKYTTDDQGQFKFQGKPGSYYIDAAIGDYVATGEANVSPDGKIVTKPDIKLRYACLILGEVTDAKTSEPIEGADVGVYIAYSAETKSGTDGTFKLRVLPVQRLQLEVKKKGYVTSRTNFSAEGRESMAFRVALKPGGVIRGKVTDEKGDPVSGIEVYGDEGDNHIINTKTKADGQYELCSFDPDKETTVSVSLDSYTVPAQKIAKFAPGSLETTVDFTITRVTRRNISGRVTDSEDKAVSDASVFLGRSSCDGDKAQAKTNENGEYEIKNVSSRANVILLQHSGFAPVFLPVEADEDQKIDAVLDKPHYAKGKIVDACGKPIPNVGIAVYVKTPVLGRLYDTNYVIGSDIYHWLKTDIRSDEKGEFSLTDLPAQGVVLGTWSDNYAAPDNVPIRIDANDNVIVMHGKPTIAGKVVDAITGSPLQGFRVTWDMGYIPGNPDSLFDTPDGSFKIQINDDRFLDRTDYKVKVYADGYLTEEKTVKTTESPNVDYSTVFKMKKAFPITGKVVDTAGKSISDASVVLTETDGLERYSTSVREDALKLTTTTDSQGIFHIDCAPSQTATVIISKDGYAKTLQKNVNVSKPVNITLMKAASLEVRAKAVGDTSTHLWLSSNEIHYTADLSKPGKAVFRNLMPENYRLQVDLDRHMLFLPIDLKPGQNLLIDVDKILVARQVVVRGVVTRRGVAVPNVSISTSQGDPYNRVSCKTNDKGEYDLALEKPGKFAINRHESQPGGHSRGDFSEIDLKPGENKFDITLPGGIISGRVIDADTGQPLIGKKIQARQRTKKTFLEGYRSPQDTAAFFECQSYGETSDGGQFALDGIPEGEIIVTVGEPWENQEFISNPFKVTKDASVNDLTLCVPQPGVIELMVLDLTSCKQLDNWEAYLVNPNYAVVDQRTRFRSITQAPAGKYKLWIVPSDGRHITVSTDIEIKPGKTTKIKIKVPAAKQRIVFKIPPKSKFNSEKWQWKPRDMSISPWDQKSGLWIGYKIKDAVSGKSVISGPCGFEWGGMIKSEANSDIAIPIKPGTYVLEAVLRDTHDYRVESKCNLWQVKTKVSVKAGKDTVISIK
jgi:hypothetical protein